MFGPELIRINYWINELIKTARSAVSEQKLFQKKSFKIFVFKISRLTPQKK